MKYLLLSLLFVCLIGGAIAGLVMCGVIPLGKKDAKPPRRAAPVRASAPPPMPVAEPPPPPRRRVIAKTAEDSSSAPDSSGNSETERNLTRLTSVYEQMPAEEAGQILMKLPDPLVEKMLRRMDERQVGKLLLTFPPERAAKLTQALAR